MSVETMAVEPQRQCVSPERAAMWAAGDIPVERMKTIHRHCESCDSCSTLVDDAVTHRRKV